MSAVSSKKLSFKELSPQRKRQRLEGRKKTKSITKLPSELLKEVFSYFNFFDRAKSLTRTCRLFSTLDKQSIHSYWKIENLGHRLIFSKIINEKTLFWEQFRFKDPPSLQLQHLYGTKFLSALLFKYKKRLIIDLVDHTKYFTDESAKIFRCFSILRSVSLN